MRNEVARPAAADRGTVADHGTSTDVAIARAAAEPVFAARTGRAWLDPSLRACEHRVDDDAIAGFPLAGLCASLRDDTDVFMAEREGVRTERFEREAVMCGYGGEVAAADAGERGLHAHPFGSGQCGWFDIIERHTTERAEGKRGPTGRSVSRPEITH